MNPLFVRSIYLQFFKRYFFCGLRCVSRSFGYVAYQGFLMTTDIVTHPSN
jgi:hypothetical protein